MNTIFTSTELCIHFRLTARTCNIFVMCECLNQKTTLLISIRINFWFCSHNLCPIIVLNYLISVRVYIWPMCFLFVCVKNRQLTENEMNKWPDNVNVLVKGEWICAESIHLINYLANQLWCCINVIIFFILLLNGCNLSIKTSRNQTHVWMRRRSQHMCQWMRTIKKIMRNTETPANCCFQLKIWQTHRMRAKKQFDGDLNLEFVCLWNFNE